MKLRLSSSSASLSVSGSSSSTEITLREPLAHRSLSNPSIAQTENLDDFEEVNQESSRALIALSSEIPPFIVEETVPAVDPSMDPRTTDSTNVSNKAALGLGSATNKSVVQCNIGDKCPVILCVLLPDKLESCHLDLEFEEADDVVFSVIGPRSVHLTGYYFSVRQSNHNDSSESYGVDIANSDLERSVHGSEEDSYEDSFIDDDDEPEVFPPSPISIDDAYDEEMSDRKKKPKGRKGSHKRLNKRYKEIESEDERNSELHKGGLVFKSNDENCTTLLESRTTQPEEKLEKAICKTDDKKIENGGSHLQTEDNGIYEKKIDNIDNLAVNQPNSKKSRKERRMETPEGVLVLDSDDEDCTLISTLLGRTTQAEEKLPKEMSKTDDKKIENGGSHPQTHDNSIDDNKKTDGIDNLAVNQLKSKKKRKERAKETPEAYNEIHNNVVKDEETLHLEDKTEEKRPAADREVNIEGGQTCDDSLPCTKSDLGNDVRLKKRRKISNEGENSVCQATMGQVNQDKGGSQNSGKDISMGNKDQKLPHDKKTDIASSAAVDDQLKDKKSKKKKKKKTKGVDENEVIGVGLLSESDKNKVNSGSDDKNVESKSSKARTLSNGLIIQDIETGKPEGKVATSGKKIKVYYVGKLRDGGQIIDSNIGKSPLKFRLGAEGVTEGWNIGLDGMHVGGKRRLTIPPTNGDGSQGAGENVPPNSWLVYDFELVGVR